MPDKLFPRLVALMLCLGMVTLAPAMWHQDASLAQDGDDDDGGDNDDDDDDGGGAGTGGSVGAGTNGDDDSTGGGRVDDDDRPSRTTGQKPRRAPASQPPRELSRFAPGEIVTLALTDADLTTLLGQGFRVLEERPVPEIGIVARRLAIPEGSTLEAARDQVRALASGGDADFNHYYRTEESSSPTVEPAACKGEHCATLEQIGWQAPIPSAACTTSVVIGVIDTGINPDHAAFAAARLDVHRLAPDSLDPSRAIHGTAVLSLLIGSPDSRSPGLLPDAQVVAVDAFHTEDGDERADVYTLATGMDFLADRGVRVINMSLAGPPNSVLEAATAALVERGVIVVAAVGNGGPKADPSYPAAYSGVIAVTAVDATDTVYRRAGQGPHVDLAAPGVEVWTAASVSGAKPKTGTSFAAPFVTAAAAAALELKPDLDAATLIAELAAATRDLGDPGRDDVYGFGLIQARWPCGLQGPTEGVAGAVPNLP
jgi:minor extracellular protease Epr